MHSKTKFFLPVFVAGLVISPDSFGQKYEKYSGGTKVETKLHQAVEVDVQTDMSVVFLDADVERYVVKPSDTKSENKYGRAAALVRVIGGSAELMVDIEQKEMRRDKDSAGGGAAISLYDFDISEEGAGDLVSVMPFASDEGFVLTIGGTIEGGTEDEYYEAVNLLNVNYL